MVVFKCHEMYRLKFYCINQVLGLAGELKTKDLFSDARVRVRVSGLRLALS